MVTTAASTQIAQPNRVKKQQTIAEVLSRIILLEQDARKQETLQDLSFLVVNDTHRILPYFQAFCWRLDNRGGIAMSAVSGVSEIDKRSPTITAILRCIGKFRQFANAADIHQLNVEEQSKRLQRDWQEHMPEHALWCPFLRRDGLPAAGVVLFRDTPFNSEEMTAMSPLGDAYRHAWYALPGASKAPNAGMGGTVRRWTRRLAIVGLIVLCMLIPVRESVLAPATLVPSKPTVVASPIAGVVSEFLVKPNERVEKDQPLFRYDDTQLKSEYDVADKQLESMKAEYIRIAQKSFSDESSKSQIELYKTRVEQKLVERSLAESRLQRTTVLAERDGIAVFADENEWIGRPVTIGEKILTLADPNELEIEILLAVEDSVDIRPGAEAKMFLNTDPTAPVASRIRQTSYQAEPTEAQNMAFRLKSTIEDDEFIGRIGWKGTAKVYSDETVTLFYYLFRRPISVLRQFIGF